MTSLQVFSNEEFGSIRGIELGGASWFVGKDVAEALGYSNPRDALQRYIDEDDVGKHDVIDSMGRKQEMTIINESGLYSLIFSSKLPKSMDFKHWVTSEVLPSIRKSGTYAVSAMSATAPNIMALSGFAATINALRRVMREQGSTPHEVAVMVQGICKEFGVIIPDSFVRDPLYQLSLFYPTQTHGTS